MEEFSHIFDGVEEPGRSNAMRHDLHEMLMIRLLSTLCSGEGCCDMALFGREKKAFLRGFMRLKHGIPSHDAFPNLFNALDPASFQPAMQRLVEGSARNLDDVIAIDGKVLRQSFGSSTNRKDALTMVQAFTVEARLVLRPDRGAREVERDHRHACPARSPRPERADRHGGRGVQHTTGDSEDDLQEKGGDWLLVLKGNQGALFEDAHLFMDDPANVKDITSFQTVHADHGRVETRTARISTELALGYRERPALDTGCCHERGSHPKQSRKPCYSQAHNPQPHQNRTIERINA